ncbi:secreted protein [Ophiostoma piceae UAMH 11346]|uniref:Secreted protein n=1 Tax=Ophiostoma piceae (strain UAMH 11346) TaxID=1262450 RepID=S3CZL0_OPHP1|nr:secreted protein [Ophiostoma piceae UAMH 11346]
MKPQPRIPGTVLLTYNGTASSSVRTLSVCLLAVVVAVQAEHLGSFQSPSAYSRPRFRYWLPDASVSADVVKADIASAAAIGMGGIELLPFYNNGFPSVTGLDWSTYNFGTPAFNTVFKAALEAHQEHGMIMDFALGPMAGNGVPASVADEGLQWDLYPAYTAVPANGSYEGLVPGWGSGKLIALVSALVLSEQFYEAQYIFYRTPPNYTQFIIADNTLTDHTAKVSPTTGRVNLSFPIVEGSNATYWIFAFWQTQTHIKNLDHGSSNPKTIWDNGSYVVDHFSAAGAKTVTKFWEDYILVNGTKELLQQVGGYSWEDSVENLANMSWTPSMPEKFQEKFGYDLRPYLPLLMFNQSNLGSGVPLSVILNTADQGKAYVNDYRSIVQDGYVEYLEALNNWSRTYLNLGFSCQPSFNLKIDMAASAGVPDLPETETLTFSNNIDGYLQLSGPVHVSGKDVISIELAAVLGRPFSLTATDLLWLANRAAIGSVNKFIIHGQSYTGAYSGTTWPGYTAFWNFADSNQNKHPAWEHGMADTMNYLARLSYFQRQGTPRTDIAIFNKQSATDLYGNGYIYTATDLRDNGAESDEPVEGWTYSCISPVNFDLPQARVENGILARDMPAWQAMVILSSQNISVKALGQLQVFADAGLPILLSGGSPGYYTTAIVDEDPVAFAAALSNLMGSPTVYPVATGQVSRKLTELKIRPRASATMNGTSPSWYTTYREDTSSNTVYLFVFNDGEASTGQVTVPTAGDSTGTALFQFDPWTGSQKPLVAYKKNGTAITIPLSLAANQTKFITIEGSGGDHGKPKQPPSCHVTASLPDSIVGHNVTAHGSLDLHFATSAESVSVGLSSGRSISFNSTEVPAAMPLTNWTLVVEHWEAPSNLFDVSTIAVKYNSTMSLSTPLVSWDTIPALANVSGLGYYSSTFSWPPNTPVSLRGHLGAYLRLDPILHVVRVWVNGKRLPVLDSRAPCVDISDLLVEGSNSVLVVVPTTMWNYIRSILSELKNEGAEPDVGSPIGQSPVGLTGSPKVVPVVKITFSR